MENSKYSINNALSQIFYVKKVTSELKESLEKSKGFWEKLKDIPGILSNDLKSIGDNLLVIIFKDFTLISNYINELIYLTKTVKQEDTLKIRAIEEMRAKIIRLRNEAIVISKTILSMIKELKLVCSKELEKRRSIHKKS